MLPLVAGAAAAGRSLLNAAGGPVGAAQSALQAVIPGIAGQLTNPPQGNQNR